MRAGEFSPVRHVDVWQPITAIGYTYASHSALPKVQDQMLVPMEHFTALRPGRPPDRVLGTLTLADTPPHLPEQIIIRLTTDGWDSAGARLPIDAHKAP
jgi:hypothetical protein